MIGTEIRELRLSKGLSVREAAQRAGISAEALSAIERGARYPSLNSLERLATALDVRFVIGPDETVIEPHH